MATFEFLRMSLSASFKGRSDNSSKSSQNKSRREYIEYLFGDRHDFFFRKTQFSFVPAPRDCLVPQYRAGFIGRQNIGNEKYGPEELFALKPTKAWKAALLALARSTACMDEEKAGRWVDNECAYVI